MLREDNSILLYLQSMCTLYDRFKNIKNGFLMRRINTFVDRIN